MIAKYASITLKSYSDIPVNDKRRKGCNERDKGMAEVVLRLLERRGPPQKMILWAHNAHVANLSIPTFKTLGSYLKQALGHKFLNIGVLFDEGGFNAVGGEEGIQQFFLMKAAVGTYEHLLARMNQPRAIIDLRPTKGNPIFDSWYTNAYSIREVGAVYNEDAKAEYSQLVDLPNKFDVIVWMAKVSPSTLLPVA